MVRVKLVPSAPAPSICPSETRRAADELSGLLRRIDPQSPAALVLRQARRELESLVRSAEASAEVVGPVRVKVAA